MSGPLAIMQDRGQRLDDMHRRRRFVRAAGPASESARACQTRPRAGDGPGRPYLGASRRIAPALQARRHPVRGRTRPCDVGGNGGSYKNKAWVLFPGLYPGGLAVSTWRDGLSDAGDLLDRWRRRRRRRRRLDLHGRDAEPTPTASVEPRDVGRRGHDLQLEACQPRPAAPVISTGVAPYMKLRPLDLADRPTRRASTTTSSSSRIGR